MLVYGRNTCRVSWFPDARSAAQGWLEGQSARNTQQSQDANDYKSLIVHNQTNWGEWPHHTVSRYWIAAAEP